MPPLRIAPVTVVLALLLTACQPAAQQGAVAPQAIDTAAIRAAIDSLATTVKEAVRSGDADLLGKTWAADGILSVQGMPPVRGRDAIVAGFRNRPPLPAGATMTVHPTELVIQSAEWAYVMGVDSLKHAPVGSAMPVVETQSFLAVLRKTAEGWQTYREVISPNH